MICYAMKKCICHHLLDTTVMYTYTLCIGTEYKVKAITLVYSCNNHKHNIDVLSLHVLKARKCLLGHKCNMQTDVIAVMYLLCIFQFSKLL